MKKFTWNDGMKHRGRTPRLFLVRGFEVVRFTGDSIPNWVAVTRSSYTKNGKWSNTTYQIAVADDVQAWENLTPWEGWTPDMDCIQGSFSRIDGESAEGIAEDLAVQILMTFFPEDGTRRRNLEKALQASRILETL